MPSYIFFRLSFITEDSYEGTVTNPLSLNLYAYCGNNPVVYADPSGNKSNPVGKSSSNNKSSGSTKSTGTNSDKNLPANAQAQIAAAQSLFNAAKAQNNIAIMQAAHDYATSIRQQYTGSDVAVQHINYTTGKTEILPGKAAGGALPTEYSRALDKAEPYVMLVGSFLGGGGVKNPTKLGALEQDEIIVSREANTLARGLGRVTNGNTTVLRTPEVKAPTAMKENEVIQRWDEFLGPNTTNINPVTGKADPARIFSADGTRSIRFDNHEMVSAGTSKFHYHEETWTYDAINDIMTVTNYMQRIK